MLDYELVLNDERYAPNLTGYAVEDPIYAQGCI